jgi:DNA integrity scanning protein DisA with diadenylate cyclase activity
MKKNLIIRFLDYGTIKIEAGKNSKNRELIKGFNVLVRVYKILILSFAYFVFVFLAGEDLRLENYYNIIIYFVSVYAGAFFLIFFPFLVLKFEKILKKITDYLES